MLLLLFYQTPAAFGPIPGNPPINTPGLEPVVTGTPDTVTVGSGLSCTSGTWTGDPTITYAYQWYQDVPEAPSITTAPFISGSATVGTTLHCTSGTWLGDTPITYDYLWWIPPTTPLGTGPDYTVLIGDLGTTIHCTVTADNAVGSVSEEASNTKGPITEVGSGSTLTDELGDPLLDELGAELTDA